MSNVYMSINENNNYHNLP